MNSMILHEIFFDGLNKANRDGSSEDWHEIRVL
jgi:hypothetical protein